MEEMVDCTTDYINFCMDTVVPVRSVRCFANNKPWITSDIKGLLNQKKKAFKDGDTQELKQIQKELRVQLREAKEQYRKKIEQRMQNNNMRVVWEGMKTITGCSSKRGAPIEGDVGRANQLNQFFNRFDHPNPFTPLITADPTLLLPQAVTSNKRGHLPSSPPHTIHDNHSCSGLWRAEEAAPQQSCRSRWSITATSEGLCEGAGTPPPAHIQPELGTGEGPPAVEDILHHSSPQETTSW
ncbi:hypothetical protein L3Q82_001634 [Scortum barcoo]|uniref:Uncharacterized protein n=1 Tax=Scortum barcoo TaxID=214431 RepID=A0ACB8W3V5_9TELE|nr:hypothetical protein L3Q82_001634 [Scortum barcoo]